MSGVNLESPDEVAVLRISLRKLEDKISTVGRLLAIIGAVPSLFLPRGTY